MHRKAPLLSAPRLQRPHRWLLLWLRWFAAFLDAAQDFAPLSDKAVAIAHNWLDRIERILVSLIVIRAAPHVRTVTTPKHSPYRRKDTGRRRAIIGSALRKKLRSKDLRQRIGALSQDIGGLVSGFLSRMPCGLTRRRPIIFRPEQRAPALACLAVIADFPADTS